jgi:hypothetical protein
MNDVNDLQGRGPITAYVPQPRTAADWCIDIICAGVLVWVLWQAAS